MSAKKYEMLKDSRLCEEAKKGTTVYRCNKPDYGCASDDTMMTGVPHISVTLDPSGDYPFFTVPEPDIRALDP